MKIGNDEEFDAMAFDQSAHIRLIWGEDRMRVTLEGVESAGKPGDGAMGEGLWFLIRSAESVDLDAMID